MILLQACELYRFYHSSEDEIFALRGVSLTLQPGQLLALTGPSGSGKSTLLNCLSGLDEPDGGHVELMGQRLSRRPEAWRTALRARYLGILVQAGNLFEHLTLEGNLLLQMRLASRLDRRRIDTLLETVGLSARRHAIPAQLSGGEAARAGLAVALAAAPQVLLADEPTAEVDAETETSLLRMLHELCAAGCGILVATHSERVAASADRVLKLKDGRLSDG
jgi:putative ABC transport system ATP-binding protein